MGRLFGHGNVKHSLRKRGIEMVTAQARTLSRLESARSALAWFVELEVTPRVESTCEIGMPSEDAIREAESPEEANC